MCAGSDTAVDVTGVLPQLLYINRFGKSFPRPSDSGMVTLCRLSFWPQYSWLHVVTLFFPCSFSFVLASNWAGAASWGLLVRSLIRLLLRFASPRPLAPNVENLKKHVTICCSVYFFRWLMCLGSPYAGVYYWQNAQQDDEVRRRHIQWIVITWNRQTHAHENSRLEKIDNDLAKRLSVKLNWH